MMGLAVKMTALGRFLAGTALLLLQTERLFVLKSMMTDLLSDLKLAMTGLQIGVANQTAGELSGVTLLEDGTALIKQVDNIQV